MRAPPNAFVLLFPVTWDPNNAGFLENLHADRWRESIDLAPDPAEPTTIHRPEQSADATITASLAIDDPLDKLTDLTATGKEPMKRGEAALVEQHEAIWRVTIEYGADDAGAEDDSSDAPHTGSLEAALLAVRLIATFTEAGSAGVFLPATQQMHGSEFVRSQASQLPPPDADTSDARATAQTLVNLFVAAWDDTLDSDDDSDDTATDTDSQHQGDDSDAQSWMISRGLTSFGLPELETPVGSGFNAAYFRLLDVASGMITQQAPYPVGAELQLGPESYTLREGPHGPDDDTVPTSATFGRLSILPKE